MSENLNTQSRKWMITINNPQTCGLDHNRILELLQLFRPDYFCLADEITGTYHTHIFLYPQRGQVGGDCKSRDKSGWKFCRIWFHANSSRGERP